MLYCELRRISKIQRELAIGKFCEASIKEGKPENSVDAQQLVKNFIPSSFDFLERHLVHARELVLKPRRSK